MRKNTKLHILTMLALGGFLLYAQPAPMQNAGQNTPPQPARRERTAGQRPEGTFSVIGIKIEESGGEQLQLTLYFNGAVDTNSIRPDRILINGSRLPDETEFSFNKNRRMTRFLVSRPDAPFSIRITNLSSFDKKTINPVRLQDLAAGDFFKYSWGRRTWQKSSS